MNNCFLVKNYRYIVVAILLFLSGCLMSLEGSKDILWPQKNMPGKKLFSNLATYWQKGRLHYSFEVYPYTSLKRFFISKYPDQMFLIKFFDEKGVLLKILPIYLYRMNRIVGEGKKKPVKLFQQLNISCSKEEYEQFHSYEVVWNLNDKLIPND